MYRSVQRVPEFADVNHVARIYTAEGALMVPSDFDGATAFTLTVYDDEGVSVYTESQSLINSPDVHTYDPVELGGYWTKDSKGYNFHNTLVASDYGYSGGRTYRAVYLLVSQTHGTIPLVFIDQCEAVSV